MSDLISRQMVLRCIKESRDNIDWGQSEDGDAFLHYTGALYRTIASEECLPSAERKRGEWMYLYEDNYKCSICGSWWCCIDDLQMDEMNYCPCCGADMRGDTDER